MAYGVSAGGYRSECGVAPFVLAGIAVVLGVLKYGIGLHPEWRRLHEAAQYWPEVWLAPMIQETDRSLLSNISASWIAGAFDLNSVRWYLVFQLLIALAAIAAPFMMPSIRSSALQSRLMFIVVVGGPVTSVLLIWVAGYDAIYVLAAVLAGLSRNVLVMAAGWFIMAFNHAALGTAAWVLWVPLVLVAWQHIPLRERVIRLVASGAALAAGWFAIRTLAASWGGSRDRWQLYQSIDRADIMNAYWAGLPLVLFGVLGGAWFVVLDRDVRRTLLGRMMIGLALIAALLAPLG